MTDVEIEKLKTECEMLRKENEYLKALVNHLASRPAPYTPVISPYEKNPYDPPFIVTC